MLKCLFITIQDVPKLLDILSSAESVEHYRMKKNSYTRFL